MTNSILKGVEEKHLKKDVPQFQVGDTVDVPRESSKATKSAFRSSPAR